MVAFSKLEQVVKQKQYKKDVKKFNELGKEEQLAFLFDPFGPIFYEEHYAFPDVPF